MNVKLTEDLSEEVKKLVEIYQKWDAELTAVNLEKFKLEAAMKAVGAEINARMTDEDNSRRSI